MAQFAEGQYVELYTTIPSDRGGSISSGIRGIVKRIDPGRSDEAIYFVVFLAGGRLDGEGEWLRDIDVPPA